MVFPVCFSFINVGPVAVSMIASVVVVAAAVLLISQCTVPGRKLVSSRLSPTDDEAGRRGQGAGGRRMGRWANENENLCQCALFAY